MKHVKKFIIIAIGVLFLFTIASCKTKTDEKSEKTTKTNLVADKHKDKTQTHETNTRLPKQKAPMYTDQHTPHLKAKQAREGKRIVNYLYVEVNDVNLLNAGSYYIGNPEKGRTFFDVVTIFAANINWNTQTQKPYLHLNRQVDAILTYHEKYIKPLQDKGIKVVLGLLPNHTGIGFKNLTDEDRTSFVNELYDAYTKYNLDGFDFDEEYAGYGSIQNRPVLTGSFNRLIKATRDKMPEAIISLFDWGLPYEVTSNAIYGIELGKVVDYAYHGSYNAYLGKSNIAGLSDLKWGPNSVDLGKISSLYPSTYKRTIEDGYGVAQFFNLRDYDQTNLLTVVSEVVYGEKTYHNGEFFTPDHKVNEIK